MNRYHRLVVHLTAIDREYFAILINAFGPPPIIDPVVLICLFALPFQKRWKHSNVERKIRLGTRAENASRRTASQSLCAP